MANTLTTPETDSKSVDQILLVDDNTTNLQLLRDSLDGYGYKLLAAKNGKTAFPLPARQTRISYCWTL